MRKLSLLLIAFFAICLSSCKNEDELFYFSVDYQFQIPDPILSIADAYVTYTDNGITETKKMTDGKFRKLFEYHWENEEVKKAHTDFNDIRIHFILKVEESSLPDSIELFNDTKSFFKTSYAFNHTHNKDNNWTGNSVSESSKGGDTLAYSFGKELRDKNFSKKEILEYITSPNPIFSCSWNYYNTTISYSCTVLGGLPEPEKKKIKIN